MRKDEKKRKYQPAAEATLKGDTITHTHIHWAIHTKIHSIFSQKNIQFNCVNHQTKQNKKTFKKKKRGNQKKKTKQKPKPKSTKAKRWKTSQKKNIAYERKKRDILMLQNSKERKISVKLWSIQQKYSKVCRFFFFFVDYHHHHHHRLFWKKNKLLFQQ